MFAMLSIIWSSDDQKPALKTQIHTHTQNKTKQLSQLDKMYDFTEKNFPEFTVLKALCMHQS